MYLPVRTLQLLDIFNWINIAKICEKCTIIKLIDKCGRMNLYEECDSLLIYVNKYAEEVSIEMFGKYLKNMTQ